MNMTKAREKKCEHCKANVFRLLLAVVLYGQFFLTSSEGCFFDIQAFPNNALNPFFKACLTMQMGEKSCPGGKYSRKRQRCSSLFHDLYRIFPGIIIVYLRNYYLINFFLREFLTPCSHISHPVIMRTTLSGLS